MSAKSVGKTRTSERAILEPRSLWFAPQAAVMLLPLLFAANPGCLQFNEDQGVLFRNRLDVEISFYGLDPQGRKREIGFGPLPPKSEYFSSEECEVLVPILAVDPSGEVVERLDPDEHCPTDVWVIDGKDG
jgi:hypothetical protein